MDVRFKDALTAHRLKLVLEYTAHVTRTVLLLSRVHHKDTRAKQHDIERNLLVQALLPQEAASTVEAPPAFAVAQNDPPAQPSEEFPPLAGTPSDTHRGTQWSNESAPQPTPTLASEQPQGTMSHATKQASGELGPDRNGDDSYGAALVADQPTGSARREAAHPASAATVTETTPARDDHRDEAPAEA